MQNITVKERDVEAKGRRCFQASLPSPRTDHAVMLNIGLPPLKHVTDLGKSQGGLNVLHFEIGGSHSILDKVFALSNLDTGLPSSISSWPLVISYNTG